METLRKLVPFLDDWHLAFVTGDVSKQAVIRTEYAGLKRSFFFWRFAPQKYVGGAVLNVLGLQFVRYAFYNLRYGFRSGHSTLAKQCVQSGIVVEPHLLSGAAVNRVLDFYRDHKSDAHDHFQDFTELVISNTRGPVSADPAYRELVDYILGDCGIRSRGEDLTGLSVKVFPFIAVLHYKSYVDQQVGELLTQTKAFAAAYKAGNDDEARKLYAPTRAYWESIEPVAESFGDLDPRLDLREADLEADQK